MNEIVEWIKREKQLTDAFDIAIRHAEFRIKEREDRIYVLERCLDLLEKEIEKLKK